MINEINAKLYCSEDISLIENYDKAVNDTTQMWECHHRLETDLGLSKGELIDLRLYTNRPANELIFLSKKEHKALHMSLHRKNGILPTRKGKDCNFYGVHNRGEKHPFYGKHHTEETKQKLRKPLSEETKQKLRKPQQKYKWLTPTGEIRIMSIPNANCWHPDWIKIGEA